MVFNRKSDSGPYVHGYIHSDTCQFAHAIPSRDFCARDMGTSENSIAGGPCTDVTEFESVFSANYLRRQLAEYAVRSPVHSPTLRLYTYPWDRGPVELAAYHPMAEAAVIDKSAEKETLNLLFHYLVDNIDAAALLPAALSARLISDRQRSDCASEADPYVKAEKFVGHLQRAVNGDTAKFYTFLEVLHKTNQGNIASRLQSKRIITARARCDTPVYSHCV